jgi:hypothetical protein
MATQEETLAQGVALAQQFKIFTDDARGRKLLQFWRERILERPLPSNASSNELAFHNGQVSFVCAIMHQIELASTPVPTKSDPFK